MKPLREPARHNQQTYFVSSQTWGRRGLFQSAQWAELFIKMLFHYRSSYLLHEFVLMSDHFHLLITPKTSLEKAVQFIKGGFSHRAKVELGSNLEIWQRSFTDHRIRDAADYQKHVLYIHENPVRARLCSSPGEYPYSSASRKFDLDTIPQWLKPPAVTDPDGTAEAVPLRRSTFKGPISKTPPVTTSEAHSDRAEAVPLQRHAAVSDRGNS